MSFRVQIALFGAAVVGLALLVFSLLVYGLASRSLPASQDRDLMQRSERALAALNAAGPESFAAQPLATADLIESSDSFIAVFDAHGKIMSSTAIVNGAALSIPADVLVSTTPTTVELSPGSQARVVVQSWSRPDLGRNGYLVVGQPLRGLESTQAGIRGFLWISGAFTFVAALVAIWLVAGRALRPLDLVANTAEDIRITGDLGRRLPESRGWIELNRLARAFNGMLDRLAGAIDAQRRFVADASHELRTPLTTIRSNAGLLLSRQDITPQDRQSAVRDIVSEAERMSRLVHDLLTLARADAGVHLERSMVDLSALVTDVARQAQQLYADRHFSVEVCSTQVNGDADALKQLQWILLDNAVRFAGPGGSIRLRLVARDPKVELSVADNGPGISPADRERIFERFFQADDARAGGGAGLGLSIARWIVDEHGGTIAATDNGDGGGAAFVVSLPRA